MDPSRGKELMNDVPFLPLEIIFHILLYLPAEFLYDCVRYVCKAWASIIRDPAFIEAHSLKSKGGFLIQESSYPYRALFLNIEDVDLRTTNLSCSFRGIPMDSCRGLCLFFKTDGEQNSPGYGRKMQSGSGPLYVANPVTMQIQPLPSLGFGCYQFCHLVYILQSRVYKVLCLFSNSGNCNWFVFTLGIDVSWRKLNAKPTPNILNRMVYHTSASVGQFVYLSESKRTITALNLYDETDCCILLPNAYFIYSYWLVKMGDNLSCVAHQGLHVHMWMLRDLEKCEWVKVCDNKEAIQNRIKLPPLPPIGWLDNSQIFVSEFRMPDRAHRSFISAYNAETGTLKGFHIYDEIPFHELQMHTNSLIKW